MKFSAALLALLIFSNFSASTAHADFWSDAGHFIERSTANLGRAGGDIITLGQEGRDRDAAWASHQQELAEQANRAAQTIKESERKHAEETLAQEKEKLANLDNFRSTLGFLSESFLRNLKLTSVLYAQLQANTLRDSALQAIVDSQREDLRQFAARMQTSVKSDDAKSQAVLNSLQSKVQAYFDQISSIPKDEDKEQVINDALTVGGEISATLMELSKFTENKIGETKTRILTQEDAVKKLQ